MTEPLLLGVREWAREAGLGRDVTYELVRAGRIRCVRVNRRILIPRSELEEFIRREAMTNESVTSRAVVLDMLATASGEA